MQQISAVGQKSPLLYGHVAPHLFHPLLVRMGRDSVQTNPPTLQLDKEQHVVGNQALERKHFHREKIRSHQNIHMSADEIFPTGRVFSFGGRRDSVATQDVAPPSGPIAACQDWPRHPRCDHSPRWDSPSPSAPLNPLSPHRLWAVLRNDGIWTRRTC